MQSNESPGMHDQKFSQQIEGRNWRTESRESRSNKGYAWEEYFLYSVHVHHKCVHIKMTHRHMLTAAPCSRLTKKSHHTLLRSHCSCTLHGIMLNAFRNLDGSGAWSQTAASGNVHCLSRPRDGFWVSSKYGRLARSVEGTRGEKRRVHTETGGRWKQRAQHQLHSKSCCRR